MFSTDVIYGGFRELVLDTQKAAYLQNVFKASVSKYLRFQKKRNFVFRYSGMSRRVDW
jgi:hypothetical protein